MKKFLLYLSASLIFATVSMGQNRLSSNKNITIQPSWNEDEQETLMALWDNAFTDLKKQKGAGEDDFKTFLSFNKQAIEKENGAFFTGVKSGAIAQNNASAYINAKMAEMSALYDKYVSVKKEFPTSAEEFNGPSKVGANICSSDCSNIGFEDGDLTGWYAYYGINNSVAFRNITGITGGLAGGVQKAALDPNTGNTYQVHLTSTGHNDWFLNTYSTRTMSQVSPYGGNYSCMIGDSINNGKGTAILEQTYQVSAANPNLSIQFSVFTELPPHTYWEQPFFQIFFLDQNGDTIRNCGLYQLIAPNPDSAYKSLHNLGFVGIYYPPRTDSIYWKDWTLVDVNLSAYIGQCVTVGFEVGDCQPSGHCAWAYVDASCSPNKVISSSPAICGQDTITLSAPPGFVSYQWSGPAGGIVGSSTNQSVTVDSAGSYCVNLIPITGQSCADTICITVNKVAGLPPHPTFSFIQTGCSGDTVCFTNTSHPDSAQGGKFYWDFFNLGVYTDSTASPCFIYHVPGTYTIKLHEISSNGCGADTFATITILPVTSSAIVIANTSQCKDTGSAAVSPCGGVKPYTYFWSNGKTTDTITGLSAGSYSVTVTDSLGNSTTASVTITQSPAIIATTAVTGASCNSSNGTATVSASGGTSPYTYLWNPGGQTNATATGLSAGTYTVTVTDNSGCTGTATATITQPALLNATTSSTSATCGQNNGTATVTVSGGNGPYTYLWLPGNGTTSTISSLSAGTYTVTIYDANGCNVNASVTVANSSGINTSITSVTEILCNGNSTGSATVTATGGTPPYTYLWAPSGGTNPTATGLSAGIYTVTVTDINGCNTPAIAIITQPTAVRDSVSSITYPLCNGGTGSASIGVKGGISPYTYSWNPGGQTSSTVSSLTAGSYTVTVTDNHGCRSQVLVSITQPTPITGTYTTTPTTCGNDNGTITATINGGTQPYTYVWNPGGQTTASITGLSAGTYTLTITDNNGCSRTGTATINATNSPTVTVTATANDRCNGDSTGTATATVTGGNAPYTYLWAPVGKTTAVISGLTAGTYTVTVHDSSGCVTTATITITQPTPVTGTTSSTGVLCNRGTTGTATVLASGGNSPYTYLWHPGNQTNATATGLSAGTYTVDITDANGCTSTAPVIVTQPPAIKDSASSITYPKCNGGTGSATIGVSGGIAPYTYTWSPNVGTNATETGLSVGSYTVSVQDNNGCTGNVFLITITQPTVITLTTHENSTPCGSSNGLVWVSASGGTGPYTYLWNPTSQTTDSATGLSAGTYTVIVTDANGCTQTATETVTTTTSIILSVGVTTGVICNGQSNGSGTVNASGGTAPYTYQWNPSGGTNATESGLSAGAYTVTVTDSIGCDNTIVVTITQPGPLAAPISDVVDVSCFGGSNGSISVSPSGGTQPYTYLWAPSGNTTAIISGLSIGTYTLTLTDNNGCFIIYNFTVTQPTALLSSAVSTPTTCSNDNGTAIAVPSGGTAPYTYNWNPSGQTNATATGLSAGIYTVTVTDFNGCSVIDTITVNLLSTLSISASNTDLLCNGASTGTATVSASGGTTPYTYLWNPGGQTNATATGLTAGSYTITVTDNGGCTLFAVVTITQPTAIVPITATTGAGCANNSGSATVTASGGTGAYTYSWAPGGGTASTISGLGSGNYTVTVTDANGCTGTALANVANGGVSGSITASTNIACFGDNTGSATVTAEGNATPFTYLWTPGSQTNSTATGLTAGSYTVAVTDNNGCTFTATVSITGPSSALTETNIVTNASCNSTNNGSIALNVSGGTPQYTFSWSNGNTTQNISNILPGSYTVTIKDSNGCTLIDSMKVGFDSSVFADAGRDTVLCHNSTIALNGTGSVNATGYAWYQMPGFVLIGNTSIVNVTPVNDTTTYILVVQHGSCSDTSSVTIVLSPAVSADAGPSQDIYGTGTVTIGGSPTGPGGSSYLWNPNFTLNDSIYSNPTATPTVTTIYTVTVTNSAGCSATDTVTIFVLPGIVVPSGFTPNGDGTNDTWVLPFAEEFPNIVVEVYNRWGELLFHSDGYNIPWDGTYNGKAVPVGTYYYIINLNDPRFPKAQTGPVTILR